MGPMTAEAFDRYVFAHERELRSYLAGMGVPLHVIDDLAQEVFIDYYLQADGDYRAGIAWLKGMARNKAREWFRKNGRQRRLRERYAELLESCPKPFAQGDGELLEQLAHCLHDLPSEHGELLERYYGGEEDAAGIAASLGRKLSALRMQVLKLREALRRCVRMRMQESS